MERYEMLEKLIIDQNKLKSIGLHKNTNLTMLSLNLNNLQQINLNNNNNLTYLSI